MYDPSNTINNVLFLYLDTTIKPKEHKCDQCNKVFRTPSCLKLHNINHHGAKSSFQCNACKRHFLNHSRLTEHVRIVHTGEKVGKEDNLFDSHSKILFSAH